MTDAVRILFFLGADAPATQSRVWLRGVPMYSFSCQGFAPILLEVAIQTLTRGCKLFLTIFKNLYATLDHIYQRSMQDKIVQKKLAQVINSTVIRFSVYVIR